MESLRSRRSVSLDLVRIGAALWVLFHHWLSSDGLMRNLIHPYEVDDVSILIKWIVKYGYLGVDIFFIISGVVISRSALGRSWSQFGVARFSRLFPSYFAATLITIILGPAVLLSFPELKASWLSLTGFQWFFGYPTPVGPAWTLFIEIRFYLLVAVLLAVFGSLHRDFLLNASKAWLLIIALAPSIQSEAVHFLFITEYGCYFALGMILGLCSTREQMRAEAMAICVAFILCWVRLSVRVDSAGAGIRSVFIAAIILLFMIAVVIWSIREQASTNRLVDGWRSEITVVALMSYPIYLLHEPIGMPLIGYLVRLGVDRAPAFAAAFAVVMGLSWLCVIFLEPTAQRFFGRKHAFKRDRADRNLNSIS